MRRGLGALAAAALLSLVAGLVATPAGARDEAAGTVEVQVRYAGTAVVEKIKVSRDVPTCGAEVDVEKIAVGPHRGLANAVAGIADLPEAPPRGQARLEQRRCAFHPRVLAMAPGDVEFVNADPVFHNLHTFSAGNPALNTPLPKGRRVTQRFEKPEVVEVTCDIHPWMQAWIAVMPNAAFAVTDAAGTARIDGVPPGRHRVEVWHEVLGRQVKDVDVRPGQTAHVTFEMKR